MEDNGFALVAATAPGSHWGNWRSLTRCDCKVRVGGWVGGWVGGVVKWMDFVLCSDPGL